MIRRADRSVEGEARSLAASLFTGWGWVLSLVAFLIVIPLFLWSIFTFGGGFLAIAELLFCVSFGWLNVSMLQYFRAARRLGASLDPREVLSSPRPADPDEFLLWKWTRHFVISWLVLALGMLATVTALVLFDR